jgi:alanyl-tRNA synthetase
MEYFKNESGEYQFLPQKNVDTGIGFERLIAVLEKRFSAYETDLFWPIIQELERTSSKKYNKEKRNFRILADHIRGAVFLISEGIFPSNYNSPRSIFSLKILNCALVSVQTFFFSPIMTLSSCTSTTGHFCGMHTSPIHSVTFIILPPFNNC